MIMRMMMMTAMMMMAYMTNYQGRDSASALQEARLIFEDHDHNDDDNHDLDVDGVDFDTTIGRSESFFSHAL